MISLSAPRNTTQWVIPGTITFRLASRGWFNKRWGTNLQNIEKDARRMYVPDEGKIFVQTDQSGAEALIVAYLCKHGLFRDLFLHGIKPHVFVALHLFKDVWKSRIKSSGLDIKCDIDELCRISIDKLRLYPFWNQVDKLIKSSDNWQPEHRYYYIAKQICHSSNYGVKAGMFCLNTLEKSRGKIVIKEKQAREYLSFYHGLFTEIKEWHQDVQQQVESTRILYNLQGFPRYFGGEINERSLKEAYAFIPQSTVGTITNIAYSKLQSFIEKSRLMWDMLANTHDSYLSQCPIDEALECAKMQKLLIEQDLISSRGEPFKMRSETVAGYNWAPVKPIPKELELTLNYSDPKVIEKYNLNGLKEVKL